MAYTVKIVISPYSPKNAGTASDVHQTAVKDYLDAQSITTLYVTTTIVKGRFVTTIVYT